jgi:hypothetical protein
VPEYVRGPSSWESSEAHSLDMLATDSLHQKAHNSHKEYRKFSDDGEQVRLDREVIDRLDTSTRTRTPRLRPQCAKTVELKDT